MPSSYNLPELLKKEIDALVKSGYYSSKSDVVKDALRYMLENKKGLRVAAAMELYKKGEVSLGKAAEIASMGVVEFKEKLKQYDVRRVMVAESAGKMDREQGCLGERFLDTLVQQRGERLAELAQVLCRKKGYTIRGD